MKLDHAITEVQEAEAELGRRLRIIGERHAVEHDLYHLGHTLARQCAEHLDLLAPLARKYGAEPVDASADSPGLLEKARHKGAELLGRTESAGLLLLDDLRDLYLCAQQAEISWTILQQAAKAARDQELLQVITKTHPETEMCAKWLRTRIKETSPQVLATG
ncbi:hypothetical protein [Kribbella sp. NPDC023855]|uniref:hypothetical protein n=1 Tax=Kribbella sp. NPDC023855 TaxID=3154698 RepID=UPI0033FA28AB